MTPFTQKIWLNKPQLKSNLIMAKDEYGVWGRGTGKTEGPMALRSIHFANTMPRGATGLVAATFMQALTRTFPALEKGWQRYGYKPGVHYWPFTRPPKQLNIPDPVYNPRDSSQSIFWWNGHVFHLMSLDRPGLANGKTVDAISGDEAKLMNYDRYMDDIEPTNRGNKELFGHLAHHHGSTFFTDMPTDQSGKWILEKEKEVNHKQITDIINLQLAYNQMELEAAHPRTTKPRQDYLYRKMRGLAAALNELRRGSVWYSEASSLANIEVLGEQQFKDWKRKLKPHIYQAAILNKRIIHVENGFYPLLNLDKHCYDNFNYNYIDSIGLHLNRDMVPDCRFDADVDKVKPLDISMDANARHNCIATGQERVDMYRVLHYLFVKGDDRIQELMALWVAYYKHHPTKQVNFYYDHTFVGTDGLRIKSYADVITQILKDAGWKVKRVNIGQQPLHDTRFRMWGTILKEDNLQFKPVRFNRTNCAQLLISMQRAGVIKIGNKHQKDKRDEKNTLIPPEDTTHGSDAIDTLIIGINRHKVGYAMQSSSLIMG
jgi:hypothetical protein